jgi:hypothetical protein
MSRSLYLAMSLAAGVLGIGSTSAAAGWDDSCGCGSGWSVYGPGYMNYGPAYMNYGPAYMNYGPDYMDYGPDYMCYGPAYMNYGPDYMDYGPGFLCFGSCYGNCGPISGSYIRRSRFVGSYRTLPDTNTSIGIDCNRPSASGKCR